MSPLLRNVILSVLTHSLALWILLRFLPAHIALAYDPFWLGVIIVGTTFGLLNTFVKPFLKLLSLPFIIVTLGLFLLVINAFLLWILETLLSGPLAFLEIGLAVGGGFWTYVLVGFVFSILNSLLNWFFR